MAFAAGIISGALTKARGNWRFVVSAPFITGMIIPIVFTDVCATIYQQICFRLYGIPIVKRSAYIQLDRHELPYLSWREKWYCWYCSYANGVIYYVRKIAAETERMWCPIKHAEKIGRSPQSHQVEFATYGSASALTQFVEKNHQRYKLNE